MRAASLDIGIYNTGIYIEDFEEVDVSEHVRKPNRYKYSGEPTEEFQKTLDEVYKNGKCVYTSKISFCPDVKKKFIDEDTLLYISKTIKSIEIIKTCDIIIIEKQLDVNKKAKRIENHIQSILLLLYPHIDTILYNPSNKTQVLGAPKKIKNRKGVLVRMTKPQRKKWACETAKNILNTRGDMELYDYLFVKNKKPDDEADCICQLQSFKYKLLYEKSIKINKKNKLECDDNVIQNIFYEPDQQCVKI